MRALPSLARVALFAAIGAASVPVHAQGVVMERNISLDLAMTIAQGALEACRKSGEKVTVTVVDRGGIIRVQLRDDGSSPHTTENSFRKAYTARTFRAPSANLAEQLKKGPVAALVLANIAAAAGALPIKVGTETIGAAGVSGSPTKDGVQGGLRDAACVQAGLDKVAAQLK